MHFTDKELMELCGWKVLKEARTQSQVFSDLKVSDKIISGFLKIGRKKIRTLVKMKDGEPIPQCSCPEFQQTHGFCSHSIALLLQAREVAVKSENKQDASEEVVVSDQLHVNAEFVTDLGEILSAGKKAFSLKFQIEKKEGNGKELAPVLLSLGIPCEPGSHLVQLPAAQLVDVLRLHAITPFLEGWLGSYNSARFPVEATREGEHLHLSIPVLSDWQSYECQEGIILVKENSYHLVSTSNLSDVVISILLGGNEIASIKEYFATISKNANIVDFTHVDNLLLPLLDKVSPEFSIHLEGTVKKVGAVVKAHYEEVDFELFQSVGEGFRYLGFNGDRIDITNVEKEMEALSVLLRSGFTFEDGCLVLEGEKEVLEFIAYAYPDLTKRGWKISMMGGFRALVCNATPLSLRLEIDPFTKGDDFVSIQYSFETDQGQGLKAADAQRLMQSGRQSFKLKNGRVAVVSRREYELITEVVRDCDARQSAGKYLVPIDQVAYLMALGVSIKGEVSPYLNNINGDKVSNNSLHEKLRPYQREGLKWLFSCLKTHQFALLADDMGLGKTIQTLAVLEAVASGKPTLIVCPASLIPNWQAEIGKWLPDYDADTIHITSYQKYLRDAENQQETTYELCVLDEASMIKNPDSKAAKALCEQPASYRLALTGTPLENSAADLWSIFRFLSPRYLGKRAKFIERFVKPVETSSYTAELTNKRLRAKLHPVVLRRTKQSVLTELPPKTYRVEYCAPSLEQVKEFAMIKKEYEELKESDEAGRIQILTSILRMRQAANDLRLSANEKAAPSPKVKRLLQVLDQAKMMGKKVLVFSQFSQMLELLHTHIDEQGYGCSMLTGKTRDREAQIEAFRRENDVFLISLKAGGYGLNLTEASIVIHVDPWWNPAVENQATDRAYRMGQSEPVSVIKLITQDSIDERILALQKRKQGLYSAAIDEGGISSDSGITTHELQQLLG